MNAERLIQTLNHILEHPKTWYQKQWHCGIAHNFAGHGQINSGKEMNDDTCFIDAQEWYDLNREDAEWLFSEHRTLPEIYAFVEAAKDGEAFFDEDGYNPYGYDTDGYDTEGYNYFGYDRDEYDREGYNYFGYDRDGYDRYGFDREGYDEDGFDRDGFDRKGEDTSGNTLPLL